MQNLPHLTREHLLAHEPFLRRLAQRLVRDEATALDLVQETLLRAMEVPVPAALESGLLPNWLARILRNRAIDRSRRNTSRRNREQAAANPEAIDAGPSALERLEVSRSVIAAVLALEEPYRGVVLESFYEERSPAEIAARRGVPASTVRAQLSRALAQLRGRLDREHGGDRSAWGLALLFAARPRVQASAAPSQLAAAAVVLAALSTGAILLAPQLRPGAMPGSAARLEQPVAALPGLALGADPEPVRSLGFGQPPEPPIAARQELERETPAAPTPGELVDALVTRARQIRREVLDRLLAVDAELERRFAFAAADGRGGVFHLLDRGAIAERLSLPWLQGGGAFFSFSSRSHDYQTRAQIEYQGPWISSGFAGGDPGVWLDLGPGIFDPVACASLEGLRRAVPNELVKPLATLLTTPLADESGALRSELELESLGSPRHVQWKSGHSYLLRSLIQRDTEVLVLVQIVEAAEQRLTLAWRLFEQREFPRSGRRYLSPVQSSDVPAAPAELQGLSTPDLLDRLTAVETEARPLLLEVDPGALPARVAGLLGRSDAGVFRLLETDHGATELIAERGGGAYYSLARRSHSYDQEPDVNLAGQELDSGFYGGTCAAIVDLGAVTLAEVPGALERLDPALVGLFHSDPETAGADFVKQFRARASELEVDDRARARPGHSYLLRSHLWGEHDLLAAIELLECSPQGALCAYQILASWPVEAR
jgi:RNA polymerase sigma-70 factor (ECF subfamily)